MGGQNAGWSWRGCNGRERVQQDAIQGVHGGWLVAKPQTCDAVRINNLSLHKNILAG